MSALFAFLWPAFVWSVASLAGWAAVSALFVGVWVLKVRWLSGGAR